MHQKFHLWMILILLLNGCTSTTPVPAIVGSDQQTAATLNLHKENLHCHYPVRPTSDAGQLQRKNTPSTRSGRANLIPVIGQLDLRRRIGMKLIVCNRKSDSDRGSISSALMGYSSRDGEEKPGLGRKLSDHTYPFRLPYVDDQTRRVAASADASGTCHDQRPDPNCSF